MSSIGNVHMNLSTQKLRHTQIVKHMSHEEIHGTYHHDFVKL